MTPEELKQWRASNNYSQSELAKILDVIPLTVSRWERGVREIPSFLHLALECVEKKRGGEQKKRTLSDSYPIIEERIYIDERKASYRAMRTKKKKERR